MIDTVGRGSARLGSRGAIVRADAESILLCPTLLYFAAVYEYSLLILTQVRVQ